MAMVSAFPWSTAIAGYAAGASTMVGAFQLARELPRLRISATALPHDPETTTLGEAVSAGEWQVQVVVANTGLRPITVKAMAFLRPATPPDTSTPVLRNPCAKETSSCGTITTRNIRSRQPRSSLPKMSQIGGGRDGIGCGPGWRTVGRLRS